MISAASLLPLFLHFDFGFLARTAHCPRLIDPSSTPESRVRLLELRRRRLSRYSPWVWKRDCLHTLAPGTKHLFLLSQLGRVCASLTIACAS
ncbi:hypothetical protein M747DRAFT_29725 [Aspergillus niger ATCC 13496]|uniref:Secreted protein n=1 Tax=Aspergillus niger ATCC 13496 TaxID=1353008 RepID=A0A370C2E6_ASPNG|nr:hypothetical protein M747DRAFT_29725 [Aspergillus niger ATCC 13496]